MAGEAKAGRNRYDRLRPVRRFARPFEAAQVRRFGRSLLSVAFRTPVLVLHTTGRKSGSPRSTTLAFTRADDGSLVVVGGAGGQARPPDWVANLRESPVAAVTVRRARLEVHVVELMGAEREAVWRYLREGWPRIDTYERRAGRTVPVFRLIPVHGPLPAAT
ncbi:MAG: nitroreductase/quinone reductase family protein [Acidimicrobiales bacterium]|nr:nitroreductase/quinone reductase family protein [Acidimicrobiales bacterium]